MFSVFPQLFALQLLAPFLLRVAIGFCFLKFGVGHIRSQKNGGAGEKMRFVRIAGVIEIVLSILLIIGLFTQAAALIGVVLMGVSLIARHRFPWAAPHEKIVYKLLLVVCFSIMLLGAGSFGFDLPL